ncbi:hypothetical protein [Paenarthrobacter sp. NPDC090522]|uniref:hypothetical protein n=1 Tax=Paenarthrobacter sp. NPDC090522 TaxID=3364383 RepID=UPI0037F3D3DA
MKSRTLIRSRCHTQAPTTPTRESITTPRYEAAKTALAACWGGRPKAFTPEREHFELHELKDARAEVRAAWIEAANLHGINPDLT